MRILVGRDTSPNRERKSERRGAKREREEGLRDSQSDFEPTPLSTRFSLTRVHGFVAMYDVPTYRRIVRFVVARCPPK